jgi:MFS family permease
MKPAAEHSGRSADDRLAAAADLADPAADLAAATAGARVSTRAWIMWSAAVAVYFVAVFNRSSLEVAGPDAERRFGINAASLSTFAMLQLLVYAAMQIPVGLLVDRFGPRRLLVAGLSVICLAQAAFAAVDSFGLALLARGLLGCGDAMVFISVLRIVVAWFPSRRVALVTQLTSLAGAAGGIASAWPLAWALRQLGWSGTFLAVAAIGACVLVLPAGVVRDAPHGSATHVTRQPARLRDQMRNAWSRPQTRLGLWIHFTTGFPAAAFSLLWGYPFLVQGEGVGSGLASALLTLLICANMACCFAFGVLLTQRPELRVPLALGVASSTALALTAVLLWPGRAPLWLLIVLVFAYAGNGAGSMIGFDVARGASPPEQLGTASGMVNVGTFIAAAITLVATGILVDATGAEHAASAAAALDGFKVAFCFPYLLLALGSFQIVRLSRTVRRGPGSPTGALSLSWSYQQGVPVRQD